MYSGFPHRQKSGDGVSSAQMILANASAIFSGDTD